MVVVALSGCAPQQELMIVDAVAPIRASGQSEPVAVGPISAAPDLTDRIIGNFHGGLANIPYTRHDGKILEGLDRKFRLMAFEELASTGYRVAGQKHEMLSSETLPPPTDAAFVLSGVVSDVDYNTYSSVAQLSSSAVVAVDWNLTNQRSGVSVYSGSTKGEAKGQLDDVNVITEAVRGSLRRALADPAFSAAIESR